MYQYATEPQSIGRVLDDGFKLYTFSFSKVIGFAVIAALLYTLPNFLIPDLQTQDDPAVVMQALQSYGWLFLIISVFGLVFYNAIYYRMDSAVRDPDKDFANALAVGLKKLLPVFAGFILYSLALAVGLFLLVIPGIVLSLSLLFYHALIVLDNEGILSSLKKSHQLVWGNWWRTATVFLIPGIIIIIIFMALGFGVAIVVGVAETSASFFIDIVTLVVSALLTPLFFAILLVQLNDLKLRKQGLDLEKRLTDK